MIVIKNSTANIIKIIAAFLVLFSHSFVLSNGLNDYLSNYTNDTISFGAVSVAILFAISGYYIMYSLDKKGTGGFIKKRVIRLIPSLFLVVVFCIIFLGLFFCELSLIDYVINIDTIKYLLNIVLIPIHNLPGVFVNNIYGSSVNGSLWTMPIQFMCYIYVFVFYCLLKIDSKNKYKYLFVSVIIAALGYTFCKFMNINIIIAAIRPFLCFVIGGLLYHYNKNNIITFVITVLLSIVCLVINNYISLNVLLIIFIPYIILYMCKNLKIVINNSIINYILSCSYEIYLLGFPIQQAIVSINGGSMNSYLNFAISIIVVVPISMIIKYLSDKIWTPKKSIEGDFVSDKHTFVILAYKESKYLEYCIESCLNQSISTNVIIATSTPNKHINELAKKYKLDVVVNKSGSKGIGYDFDFAQQTGKTKLVTVAHQDDIYDYNYAEEVIRAYEKQPKSIIIFPDYYEIKREGKVYKNLNLNIKQVLLFKLRFHGWSNLRFIKRSALRLGNAISCPAVTFVKDNCPEEIFASDMKCDIDWLAWERLSKTKGYFYYIHKALMGHRIYDESTTSKVLKDNGRIKEDYEMFCKFWVKPIAKILAKFYQLSEKSNDE